MTVRFSLSKNGQNTPFCQQGRVVPKMPYFVFRLKFSVFNIFSKFFTMLLLNIRSLYPIKFKFVLQNLTPQQSLIVRYPISGFVLGVFWEIRDLTVDDRCGYSFYSIFMKLSGKNFPSFSNTIAKKF